MSISNSSLCLKVAVATINYPCRSVAISVQLLPLPFNAEVANQARNKCDAIERNARGSYLKLALPSPPRHLPLDANKYKQHASRSNVSSCDKR